MLPRSLFGAEVVAGAVQVPGPCAEVPSGGRVEADRRTAVLQLPKVATFSIEAGRRVVVDVVPGASERELAVWLAGPVAALVLAQRGRFALHANLIEIRGQAIAVAGPTGAGKTTTSLRLAQRGAALGGDDVLPLTVEGEAVIHTTTGRPLRIDRETAGELGLDVAQAESASPPGAKLLLQQPSRAPGPLGCVVVLAADGGDSVESKRVTGAEAARQLRANLYRPRLLGRIWERELFEWAAAVAARVPVHVVRRPAARRSVDQVAAAVEELAA
jgi:hypothetical protein